MVDVYKAMWCGDPNVSILYKSILLKAMFYYASIEWNKFDIVLGLSVSAFRFSVFFLFRIRKSK